MKWIIVSWHIEQIKCWHLNILSQWTCWIQSLIPCSLDSGKEDALIKDYLVLLQCYSLSYGFSGNHGYTTCLHGQQSHTSFTIRSHEHELTINASGIGTWEDPWTSVCVQVTAAVECLHFLLLVYGRALIACAGPQDGLMDDDHNHNMYVLGLSRANMVCLGTVFICWSYEKEMLSFRAKHSVST